MTLTVAGVAALAFVIALGLMFKKFGKKIVPWLMLIAGGGLAGALGAVLTNVITGAVGGFSSAVSTILGAGAVGGLLVIAWLTIVLLPHMKPKGQPPTRFTPWVAFMYLPVLVAVGGIFSGLAGLSGNVVTQAASLALATFTTVIQGF
jgi:hypothetical protein